jgi:hypothetical protein
MRHREARAGMRSDGALQRAQDLRVPTAES